MPQQDTASFTHLIEDRMARSLSCCFLLLVMFSCGEQSLTTHTSSTQFKAQQEKMDFLKRYLVNHAGLQDAEYRIDYQDNSGGGVSGPSDYDMRIALRIAPDSLAAWTNGLQRQPFTIDRGPWGALTLDSSKWRMNSSPELYGAGREVKLVYRSEGIVLTYYGTMPLDLQPYKHAE